VVLEVLHPPRRLVRALRWGWWGLLAWVALAWTVYLDGLVGELTVSWSAHAAVALAPYLLWQLRTRRWRAAALSGVGVALGLLPWAPQLGDPRAPAPEGPTLRFMVANTFYAPPRLEALTADLEGAAPDVLALVEPPATLPEHLAGTGRWRVLAAHVPGNKNNIALLVREGVPGLEVLTATAAVRAYTPSVPLEAELSWRGQRIHVIAAHPPAPTEPSQHTERLRMVPDLAASLRAPGVLLGDLNATRASPLCAHLMQSGLQRPQGDVPGTWPSIFGPLAVGIDHVLAKGDLSLGPARAVWLTRSDHRGVVVEVGLRPRP